MWMCKGRSYKLQGGGSGLRGALRDLHRFIDHGCLRAHVSAIADGSSSVPSVGSEAAGEGSF